MKRVIAVMLFASVLSLAITPLAFASGGTATSLPSGTIFSDPTVNLSFNLTDPHGIKSATVILADSTTGATLVSKQATLSWGTIRYDDPETGDYWFERDYTKATAKVTFTGVQDRTSYAVKVKTYDKAYTYQTLSAGAAVVKVLPRLAAIPHAVYGTSPITTRFPFTGWDNSTSLTLAGRVNNYGGNQWWSGGGAYGTICWGGGIPPANGLVNFEAVVAGASENGATGEAVSDTTLLPGIADKVRRYNVLIRFQDNYPSTPTVPNTFATYRYPLYLADPSLSGDACETCHDKAVLAPHLNHCGACHGDGGPVGWMGVDFPEYSEPVHDASVFGNCVDCHHSPYAVDLPQCPVCP